MTNYHKPVLLNEVLENLQVEKGKKYIDATLGDGGHTIEILKRGGIVLGIDISDKSLERAEERIQGLTLNDNFKAVKGNFKNIDEIAKSAGFDQVNGILYDLGYSSYELEEGEIGLSFMKDEDLDMRLDDRLGVKAYDLINGLSERDLTKLIFEYSDERLAKRFARAIVRDRSLKEIRTTAQLAEILADEAPPDYEHGRIHPATRTFQALRIVVNDEIGNLEQSLPRAARLLLPDSRMIVISFHSIEDKVAKQFGHNAQPSKGLEPVYKKPLVPTDDEVRTNIRARSAKMRVYVK
jgi:16S rRNA (cytosine1402-N4)-methyltransferase